MDILYEIDMLNTKSVDTLIDANVKLLLKQTEPLSDPGLYMRLVGKLNYFTVTRLYIHLQSVWLVSILRSLESNDLYLEIY